MNQRKAKQVRKLSKEFVVEWLKSMLVEEEQKKGQTFKFRRNLKFW